jgi:hypothetical protein
MATPLTLSEVRSMLPAGLSAQPCDRREWSLLRELLPSSQGAMRLLVGSCSCDLVRPRHPDPLEDERHLRARYRAEGASRESVIRALERHRRGAAVAVPARGWSEALSAFVAEHARNAGDSLYLLGFGSEGPVVPPVDPDKMVVRTVRDVRSGAGVWLVEGRPALVR